MAAKELAILLTAKNLASGPIGKVSRDVSGLNRNVGTLGRVGNLAAGGVRTLGANLAKIGAVSAGLAVGMGVGAVKAAADFEAQLKTINTVAQATPAQLDAIGAGIRKIARDTGAPLAELTQGFYDLVSAGIDAAQAQRVLESSNRLAIGGLATAAEGVDLLTTALNSYGVAADQQGAMSERFADIFAKAIEKGKVTAAELAASFASVGPIAAKSGIEIEELAAGYATLTAQGVPASEAATQMRAALVGLLSPNAKLNEIQKTTGINFAKLAKDKGLVVALERLRKEAAKAGLPLIDILGRVEGFNFAISTTGANLGAYNEDLADMGGAAGTAARQMSERQQGLNYQLSRLKALAGDAAITVGSRLLPKITPLAERFAAFLAANQPAIERFGDSLASAFQGAATWAEKVPWGAVGSGLKIAADWAARLMSVLTSLPPEAQATIVALVGLNKLTGGAVGGIVGELGKGLIKGVLGMNAGVVNINAGVVNGGGLPGGGGVPIPATAPARNIPGGGGNWWNNLLKSIPPGIATGAAVDAALNPNNPIFQEGEKVKARLLGRTGGTSGGGSWAAGGGLSPDERNASPAAARSAAKSAAAERQAGTRALDPRVGAEQAALAKFTSSTAPSMKSMEAHLANLRALQAGTPARDATNTAAIVAAITALSARIAAAVPTVNVSVTARAVAAATTSWRRTGRGRQVTAW